MVLIIYGEEIQEIDEIPKEYEDFIDFIKNLFGIEDISKFTLEFTNDNKSYQKLTNETYEDFFVADSKDKSVNIYPSSEDKKANELQIKEEKVEEEEINTNSNNINENNEIKVPEITKDMVIASIVKQVKSNMQRSRLMLEQKRKKEEEENRAVKEQINNLISDRLNNLKNELISESQIKYSQILSESQINLKNMYEKIASNDANKPKIHSLEEHPNVICGGCGMTPIVGNRYSCVYCSNLNYCEKCEEEKGFSHGHPLYKFKLRV